MPLQNRVDPFAQLFRTGARGTFLGNRGGVIHNDRREIVRPFKNQRWIACLLKFKGRRRTVMSSGAYTELFFLDEAVAFAAGHRPCAECRRSRFDAFKDAWRRSRNLSPSDKLLAPQIDAELHQARLNTEKVQRTYEAPLASLPDGCFAQIGGSPYLVRSGALLLWTPAGYTRREHWPGTLPVSVLTPRPVVECFRYGYEPEIHASASAP